MSLVGLRRVLGQYQQKSGTTWAKETELDSLEWKGTCWTCTAFAFSLDNRGLQAPLWSPYLPSQVLTSQVKTLIAHSQAHCCQGLIEHMVAVFPPVHLEAKHLARPCIQQSSFQKPLAAFAFYKQKQVNAPPLGSWLRREWIPGEPDGISHWG